MKFLIIILLTLLLGSCSPVFIVEHDLEPPKTTQGLACLKGCQSQLNQCDLRCDRKFSQCSIKAKQQAQKLLPGLLKAYPNQLQLWLHARSQYQRDLDWYEFQSRIDYSRRQSYLRHCIKQSKNKHSCRNRYGHNNHYYYDRPSFNIPRPVQPSLSSETAKLVKISCTKECGCKAKYRLCYTSCGGVVKSKKICIKNCP